MWKIIKIDRLEDLRSTDLKTKLKKTSTKKQIKQQTKEPN